MPSKCFSASGIIYNLKYSYLLQNNDSGPHSKLLMLHTSRKNTEATDFQQNKLQEIVCNFTNVSDLILRRKCAVFCLLKLV